MGLMASPRRNTANSGSRKLPTRPYEAIIEGRPIPWCGEARARGKEERSMKATHDITGVDNATRGKDDVISA